MRDSGSCDTSQLPRFSSRWTRRSTGKLLPDAMVADSAKLYEFEVKHTRQTWEQPSDDLLRDAKELVTALFPHYDEGDLQFEVDELFACVKDCHSDGPSGSVKRADGARAQ